MTWFVFFLAVTIAGGDANYELSIKYELGIKKDLMFASGEQCNEWLADDANYDAVLNAASSVYDGEILLGCAEESELPDYLLPGIGL